MFARGTIKNGDLGVYEEQALRSEEGGSAKVPDS
jgi:hypothetical protein